MAATKIIATIGPSTESAERIEELILAGVNIFRFNLKHNTLAWHKEKALLVTEISKRIHTPVGLLFDLQGAEIRIGRVQNDQIALGNNESVFITKEEHVGDKFIQIPNDKIIEQLRVGNDLSIDDGRILLTVSERHEDGKIIAKVIQGGLLGSQKSVSIPSLTDQLPSLTDYDKQCIELAGEVNVDFLALSYVRKKEDIILLKEELNNKNLLQSVIAKIETKEAVARFEEILEVTDAVMVARGDLGVELPPEQVPYYQKHIINRCVAVGKPVITATQMLESMVHAPYPTRAEVSDVANAIYDHTDALMLSAETAIGKYPREVIEMMAKTASFIEEHCKPPHVTFDMKNQTDALTHAAVEFAKQHYDGVPGYKAFVILTESGYGTYMLARHRHHLPIIALTRHEHVFRKLLLIRGVRAIYFPHTTESDQSSQVTQIQEMLGAVRNSGMLKEGDQVIMVYGSEWGHPGRTNVLRVEQV